MPERGVYAVDLWDDSFILDKQRDHYSTMGDRKLENLLNNHPLWDTFWRICGPSRIKWYL